MTTHVRRFLVCLTAPAEKNLSAIRQELGVSRSLAVRLGLEQLRKRLSEERPMVATTAEKENQK